MLVFQLFNSNSADAQTAYIIQVIQYIKNFAVTGAYNKKGSSYVSDAEAPHKTSENAHTAEPFF